LTYNLIIRKKKKKAPYTLSEVGTEYFHKDMLEEAERAFESAIPLANADDQQASLLNNMAMIHAKKGNLQEAEKLLIQSLTMKKKIYGTYYKGLAGILNNLGIITRKLGKHDLAEKYFKTCLELLGDCITSKPEPLQGTAFNNLGLVYFDIKVLDKAESCFKAAIEVMNNDNPERFIALENLEFLYESQQRYELLENVLLETKQLCAYQLKHEGSSYRFIITLKKLDEMYSKHKPNWHNAITNVEELIEKNERT